MPEPAIGDRYRVLCSNTSGATISAVLPVTKVTRLNDGGHRLRFTRPGVAVPDGSVVHWRTGRYNVGCGLPQKDAHHPFGWEHAGTTENLGEATCPLCEPGSRIETCIDAAGQDRNGYLERVR